ncbi:hypothetical protein BB561_002516 [Smittium simulii]|uniref:Tyrosinase copper-binding domain-containing protein n=1 Tax=Smittium simulii TaxID=133385 RepID=A0A2T9YQ48_9FUNG|nr:hypothetical protein BB561_002516 [Smittium simulii]
MKLFIHFIAISAGLIISTVAQNAPQCTGPLSVRKEINSLSSSEISQIKDVFLKMKSAGWWDWFTAIHVQNYSSLHSTPEFLPWHRRYTRDVEQTIQSYIPSFAMPYFDASAVCADPASSIIFRPDYFGGNGDQETKCISSGIAAGWIMDSSNSCIKREFNQGNRISSWQCPENVMSDIQTSKTFGDFSYNLELGIHGSVHNAIGGDMSSNASPNDFIFFLHHSNIDRLWLKWQNLNPSAKYQYTDYKGNPSDINGKLTLYDTPIIDSFDVGYGFNCYTYDESSTGTMTRTGLLNQKKNGNSDSITEKNLINFLDSQDLQKFFPDLVSNKPIINAPLMSKSMSPNSNTNTTSSKSTGNENIAGNIPTKDFKFNSTISLKTETSAVIAQNKTQGSSGGLKYPIPTRLTDGFLRMMGYDIPKYREYYQKQVDLANLLNSKGYVSPYL